MAKKQKPIQYQDLPETILPAEAAALMRLSKPLFMSWLITGKTPFGPIIEGKHYYKLSDEYRIIKDAFCQLVGILPKVKINDKLIVIDKTA